VKKTNIEGKQGGQMIFYLIGYGTLGKNLVKILHQYYPQGQIIIVDHNRGQLANAPPFIFQAWEQDAIEALNYIVGLAHSDSWVIPALPKHLLFDFILTNIQGQLEAEQAPVPELGLGLPFEFKTDTGTLYLSYADFTCPPDCSEPEEYCTVTGLPREKPLYQLLESIDAEPFISYVLRSTQLAPGLGGFKPEDALAFKNQLEDAGPGKFLVSTSCSCHAVMDGLYIGKNK